MKYRQNIKSAQIRFLTREGEISAGFAPPPPLSLGALSMRPLILRRRLLRHEGTRASVLVAVELVTTTMKHDGVDVDSVVIVVVKLGGGDLQSGISSSIISYTTSKCSAVNAKSVLGRPMRLTL